MDWQVILLTFLNNVVLPLIKFVVLCIYITAMLQVFKGISAVGLLKIFRDVLGVLWRSKNKDGTLRVVDPETWKTLNFVIALVSLKLLNFTLLAAFLGSDLEKITSGATWLDYIGTASLVYMGADWTFQRLGSIKGFFDGLKADLTGETTQKST